MFTSPTSLTSPTTPTCFFAVSSLGTPGTTAEPCAECREQNSLGKQPHVGCDTCSAQGRAERGRWRRRLCIPLREPSVRCAHRFRRRDRRRSSWEAQGSLLEGV